jgi:hypothetical protein
MNTVSNIIFGRKKTSTKISKRFELEGGFLRKSHGRTDRIS